MTRWTVMLSCAATLACLYGCGSEPTGDKPADSTDVKNQAGVAKPIRGNSNSTAENAKWGDLKMRFVFRGTAPSASKLDVDKNKDVCTKKHPVDESLTVNGQNNGVADVVVWLYLKSSAKPPESHPDLAKNANEPVVLSNSNCRFEPHVTLLQTGRTLVIRNTDSIGHNTKCDFLKNPSFNDQIEAGGEIKISPMKREEAVPMNVQCSAHGWMQGKIVIKQHPYMAKSNTNGELVIPNLPVGTWTFQLYQERRGFLGNLEFSTGSTDNRGKVTVKIESGVNDLGDIELSPQDLE